VTDGLGHLTQYGYDEANERIQTIQPDASVLATGYDADGNVISRIDANNHTTQYAYDVLNHLQSVTDPLNRVTGYVYDPVGNLTSLTDAEQPSGRTTSYQYDAADQLQSISYSDGVTPNVSYTYSPSGQRLTMADGTGTTSYQYDNRDRLTKVTNGAGQAVSYGYDAASNLTSIGYPTSGQSVTRTYDADNRLTSVKDWLGHTTGFGYDDNANLTSIAFPTSNSVGAAYSYDMANGLTQVVDGSVVHKVVTPFWTFGYTRDNSAQVSAASDPVQASTQHSYSRNLLDQLTQDARSGGGSGTTSWGYDAAYRLATRADSSANTTSTYTADNADELTSLVTTTGGTTTQHLTLSYNREGDRTGQTDSVLGTSSSFGYDQANRLTSYSSGSTSASYAYNGDGLRMSKTVGSTTTPFAYDQAEGLPLILQAGSTAYITGPNGLPIEQVSGSTVLYYLADGLGSTRGLESTSGAVQDSYSYDPYGKQTVVSGSAGATPFGYAGQWTDSESGLQYLRARSYDPAAGQFLSVDPLARIGR
jgi:RHS repeat-associated protein